jgi:hypothetical protein
MEYKISATELARKLGDVLGKIRYRNSAFVVERNGEPVARLSPVLASSTCSLAEAIAAWRDAGGNETAFADDLEKIGLADRPPRNPWA